MKNIITIDWEDWFHICEVEHLLPRKEWDSFSSILEEATDKILSLLDRHRTKATFFILGYSAERAPELVQRIANEGHEIAYHTYEHLLLCDSDPAGFREDLINGKNLLREICDTTVKGFRAPQWSLNQKTPWALDVLLDEGFTYDASRAPLPFIGDMNFPQHVHRLSGKNNHSQLVEFPPLVLSIPGVNLQAAGGWGLRTWPLPLVVRKVKKLNHLGSPATFCFHPVDFVKHRYVKGLPFLKWAILKGGIRDISRSCDYLFDHLEFTTIEEHLPRFTED